MKPNLSKPLKIAGAEMLRNCNSVVSNHIKVCTHEIMTRFMWPCSLWNYDWFYVTIFVMFPYGILYWNISKMLPADYHINTSDCGFIKTNTYLKETDREMSTRNTKKTVKINHNITKSELKNLSQLHVGKWNCLFIINIWINRKWCPRNMAETGKIKGRWYFIASYWCLRLSISRKLD